MARGPFYNDGSRGGPLATAILDQLYRALFAHAPLRPRHCGALHPMINHRRVPDLKHRLVLLGRVVGILKLKGCFDFERIEGARSGGYAFLRDFAVPERLQLTPAVLLRSVALNDHVLPTASGARMPVPSLGVYRQMPLLLITFHERSKV